MPISAAAIDVSVKNGSITRVISMVNGSLPGTAAKSRANLVTIESANTRPRHTTAPVTRSSVVITL